MASYKTKDPSSVGPFITEGPDKEGYYTRTPKEKSYPQGLAGPSIGASGKVKGMAKGGKVKRGKAYVVGEKGPELFKPKTAGKIVPNKALKAKKAREKRLEGRAM